MVDNGHSSHATKVWLSPGVFIDDRMATNGHQQPNLTWKQKWSVIVTYSHSLYRNLTRSLAIGEVQLKVSFNYISMQ